MLTRSNFEDFVKNLSENEIQVIQSNMDTYEYIYVSFTSYGDIVDFEPTDDNDGSYISEVSSDDWDGNSYLLLISELSEILEKE